MTPRDLVDRLAEHALLRDVPREQLAWVAAHGRLRHYAKGDVLTPKGVPVEGLHVVLSGHFVLYADRGAARRKSMEWRGGEVTGVLPYSRLGVPPGEALAEEPGEVVTIPRDHLPQMIAECHELTAVLVHVMVDRARHFTSSDLHDEKMASLGKLAAGLAHELNNPAAAVARSAKALSDHLVGTEAAARALGAARLTPAQLAAVDAVREVCLAATPQSVRSPL